MKSNILFYSFLLFIFSACSSAQKAGKDTTISYAPTAKENALLWKINGKELATESYLYGTIHMIGKEDFFLTEATKEVFQKSNKVVFEINMEEMTDFTALFSILGKVMMDGGLTLKDLLEKEDYALVNDHFSKLGLPMFMLERVKPMFLSMATGDFAGDFQSGEVKSYEMEFMEMAKAKEKEMGGLETIEYQMSVFDSIPYKEQANMLVESLKAADGGEEEFAQMVKLYKEQDLAGMQKMFASDTEGIGKYENVFLKNRNENWIPIMEQMMKEQVTFFAVGAGHLGGENGVVALLRKGGYTLTPVMDMSKNQN